MITVDEIMAQYEHLGLPEDVMETIVSNTMEAALKASTEAAETTAAQYTRSGGSPPVADPAAWRNRAERIMTINWADKAKSLMTGKSGTSNFSSDSSDDGYDYED